MRRTKTKAENRRRTAARETLSLSVALHGGEPGDPSSDLTEDEAFEFAFCQIELVELN
jgi:hypothetical protein